MKERSSHGSSILVYCFFGGAGGFICRSLEYGSVALAVV